LDSYSAPPNPLAVIRGKRREEKGKRVEDRERKETVGRRREEVGRDGKGKGELEKGRRVGEEAEGKEQVERARFVQRPQVLSSLQGTVAKIYILMGLESPCKKTNKHGVY